jgi:hypothetical protein
MKEQFKEPFPSDQLQPHKAAPTTSCAAAVGVDAS